MPDHIAYLVGTIPLASAAEVFRTVSRALGPALRWLPDGETGVRRSWLPWLEPVFSTHPAFERTDELYRRTESAQGGESTQLRYRLKPGVRPGELRFDNLPHARYAIESYREFERLKKEGVVPSACRMQVDFAGIVSVMRRFIVADQQQAVGSAYEKGLAAEIAKMAGAIPHAELAIQWDVASAVFQHLETGTPCAFGNTREEMLEAFSDWHARLGEAVHADIHLLYHLCYGDAGHRHSVEPASSALLVEFSNRLSAKTRRTIELIHMPVPRNRSDDAYFAALKDLRLKPETTLALGLVHYTDGVEGTRRRIAAARRFVREFAIGTECGFGRRPPETVPGLLAIHAELAGVARQT